MDIARRITREIYFSTMTVVNWVDVFTRPCHKHIIVDALKYCQENKGLILYAWVLMSNHLHLISGAKEGVRHSDIIRDFKKFTSKKIVEAIKTQAESRREWMLDIFYKAGRYNKKIKNFTVWQRGNAEQEIFLEDFLKQKLNYIHMNPVVAEIVDEPHEYKYSSAKNYAGEPGLLQVELLF
ncbi:REP-associated tyrosine transposase [Thermophagus sp. OGC60D27]|uniref:REP-associated tyrosine transposase n=1 Tax=Thermophagus sp. OGC60D27 TaxID=3458415 RepID=UPI004038256B